MSDDSPFVYATPTGAKVKCVVCGHVGWGPLQGDTQFRWQKQCLAGHPFRCDDCGRLFRNKQALSGHLTPRRKPS